MPVLAPAVSEEVGISSVPDVVVIVTVVLVAMVEVLAASILSRFTLASHLCIESDVAR